MRIQLLSCVLFASAALTAQVAPFAFADEVVVVAGGAAAPTTPLGVDVWPGLARAVEGGATAAGLSLSNHLDDASLSSSWRLDATATAGGAALARASLRYQLFSVPQDGVLVVEWSAALDDDATASLRVDLGDDGVIEATGGAVIPLQFGGAPFTVRVEVEVTAAAGSFQGPWGSVVSWDSAALADLVIRFVPTHAASTTYAAATCAPAPTLTARPNLLQGVELRADGATSNDGVLFVLGFTPAFAPLPLSLGCTLLIDPVATVWAPLAADGAARAAVLVPPAVRPVAFDAQAVAVDLQPLTLQAGDSVRTSVF